MKCESCVFLNTVLGVCDIGIDNPIDCDTYETGKTAMEIIDELRGEWDD